MTRVLISGGLADGGIRTHVLLLCELLRRNGAEVTVAATTTNWPKHELARLHALGVSIETTPWKSQRLRGVARLHAAILWSAKLRREFDTLYCLGYGRAHALLLRKLRAGGCALYHEVVDAPAAESSMVSLARSMGGIIVNSGAVKDQWTKLVEQVPIRTIPFLTSTVGRRVERPAVGRREVRAAFLGRLVPHKRVEWLVANWREVESRIGSARLDVYGSDYEGHRLSACLSKIINREELGGRVEVHGAYDGARGLEQILEGTDVVLLPSLYEGLPLVLVEAMRAGVPVVATKAGGTAELGIDNPDVEITDCDEQSFLAGLQRFTQRLRSGSIDPQRLSRWAEARYGKAIVEEMWVEALLRADSWRASKRCAPGEVQK